MYPPLIRILFRYSYYCYHYSYYFLLSLFSFLIILLLFLWIFNVGTVLSRTPAIAQVPSLFLQVKAMQGNKVYAELHNEVDTAVKMVAVTSLEESQDVVKQLVNFFYPTVAYLKVLFFGVL